jgi:hypothetical protein
MSAPSNKTPIPDESRGRTMIRESELLRVMEDGGKSPAPRRGAKQQPSPEVRP